MKQKMLLLKRSLKAMMVLAMLSICTSNVWAQDEVDPCFVEFRYFHPFNNNTLLGEVDQWGSKCFIIDVNNIADFTVFHLDTISKGRYYVVTNYKETKAYAKGRFWFNNSPEDDSGKPISSDISKNCYFDDEFFLRTAIVSVEAILIDSFLYITAAPNLENNIHDFEKWVAEGSMKRINLNKTNNFIFSFNKANYDNLPENHNYRLISSEIGGDAIVDNSTGRVKVIGESLVQKSMFTVEAVPVYRRLDFGNGDTPNTLEFQMLFMSSPLRLYENSGDYLNANNQSDKWGSCGGRYYNTDNNGNYKRDSLGNVLSFLGANNPIQYPSTNYAFYVDTAYINRGTGLIKPQYMLAVQTHLPNDTNGEYVIGRYLYNAAMSAYEISNTEDRTNFNKVQPVNSLYTSNPNGEVYKYGITGEARLAFAWAIHKGDSLYVLKGADLDPGYNVADPYRLWQTLTREYGVEGKSIDFNKLISENIVSGSEYQEAYYPSGNRGADPEMRTYYDYKPASALSSGKTIGLHTIIALNDNSHKDWVFSFRLFETGSDDFVIESETEGRDTRKGPIIHPGRYGVITFSNSVPVVRLAEDFSPEMVFNVRQTDLTPVGNKYDPIDASTKATVVGGTGNVTIRNAANKKVLISDVLGRTIANITASSDHISVAVLSGVIFVAIEGEKATKVVVK